MATFHLKVMTVDRCFYDDEVDRIIVRTTQGDVGILPNHVPYIAAIGIGGLTIFKDGEKLRFFLPFQLQPLIRHMQNGFHPFFRFRGFRIVHEMKTKPVFIAQSMQKKRTKIGMLHGRLLIYENIEYVRFEKAPGVKRSETLTRRRSSRNLRAAYGSGRGVKAASQNTGLCPQIFSGAKLSGECAQTAP